MPLDPTELTTLERFCAGDPLAREALLDAWLPVVLGWCARLGGPRVHAEDAAHDVFVVVLTRLEQLDDLSRFRGWLFGVTRKVLASHRRRAWVRRWLPGATAEPADQGPGPETTAMGREMLGLLERLPQGQREVLVLLDLEGRSGAEVSELLGLPEGTVRSRQRLGRAKLRALLLASEAILSAAEVE
ncbi:MAG: sigma-70 family RNA polymerase sigma factor [Alphaproteobacteria bacterium]|nr:sigma-70 family RNA polymerase sigma factor [Alphaproteobacteria bacterium]